MTTVGSLAQQNQVIQFLNQLRGQADDLQAQVSTGLKSQSYAGLGPSAGQLASLQGSVAHRQSFLDTIGTVQQRVQEQSTVLSTIEAAVQKFRANLPQGAFNSVPSDIQTQAKALLQEISDFLNTSDGNRYLFSGSLTGTQPFDATGLPIPGDLTTPVNGAPPAGYYAGNDTIPQARVDDGLTIQYGVTADNPALEKAVRVLNFLANLPPGSPSSSSATDQANIDQAGRLLDQSITGLQQISGTLALQSSELKDAQQRHQDFINLAQNSIGNIETVDPATAITQLNHVETTLQASYASISSLQQLSLVNFLK